MRRYSLPFGMAFAIALLAGSGVKAQTVNRNYIVSEKMLDSGCNHRAKSVQYYDELGRPNVLALGGINEQNNYVYTMTEYDEHGNQSRAWLPAVGGSAPSFLSPGGMAIRASSTYSNDSYAFSDMTYDALGRPVVNATPGSAWHQSGKCVCTEYISNDGTVLRYSLDASGNPQSSPSCYPAHSLVGERKTDEDGHAVEIYKDIAGNVILERRKANSGANSDTYFVYERGLLRTVIPPLYQDPSKRTASLLYKYNYDDYGRCIEKTLPGNSVITYAYDQHGRLAFMQDGSMRNASGSVCRFYLYEGQGRLAVQGICSATSVPSSADSTAATVAHTPNTSGICGTGYSFTSSLTLTNPQIEIVNYYDVYDFMSSPSVISAVHADFSHPGHELATSFLTGCLQRNSDGSYTCSVNYYDKKGNLIDTRETVPGGGCTKIVTSYSFTNKPEVSTVTMTRKGVTRTVQVTNTYDSITDMLRTVQHKYGTRDAVTTAEFSYNSLGQLSLLKQHNGAIETSYAYDLHGWLTGISSKKASTSTILFAEKLLYADGSVSPCYNGNISESRWATSTVTSYRYKYTYDGMDRMTAASFHAGGDISQSGSTAISDLGNVTVTYDANSNIDTLIRRGKLDNGYGEIDHLTYVRDGNQLRSITDYIRPIAYDGSPDFKDNAMLTPSGSSEYQYNACGSLTGDANKGISKIDYDLLGNPTRIQFSNFNVVEYVYTADGRRLKTIHRKAVPRSQSLLMGNTHTLTASETQSVDSTEYIGSFVFENNAFKQYRFDGGYITPSTSQPCKYYIKDHLGSTRILASYNGTVEQTTHYYPFGGTHHLSTNQGVQKYKYNGKEFDAMHGLNWYDYGARQYDPAIGQFTTMDPLCEKYYHISPYAYCGGNPVNRVDPTGMDWFEFDRLGRMTITENKKEDKIIVNNPNKINFENDDNTDFGEFTWELTLPYGTINSCNSGEKDGYAILEVNGNTASTQLFNFLGKATDVEWSELKPSNLDGINYLSTSHETDRESGMNSLLSDKHLSDVKEFNHTHPNGHSEPSGTKDNKEYGKAGTYGDIAFGLYWSKKYPNASFNILIPSSGEVNNYNNYLNMFKQKK